MSVEKRIKDALLPFGDPVEKSFLYAAADDLPRQYYTFSASSRGDDFGDDAPGCEVWQVNVHFFAPLEGDFSRRRQQTTHVFASPAGRQKPIVHLSPFLQVPF